MNVAAAVMVMADWRRPICFPIGIGIRSLVRRYMDVSVMIVVPLAQDDGGPVGGVADIVLRLRHAMQIHGRQNGDA